MAPAGGRCPRSEVRQAAPEHQAACCRAFFCLFLVHEGSPSADALLRHVGTCAPQNRFVAVPPQQEDESRARASRLCREPLTREGLFPNRALQEDILEWSSRTSEKDLQVVASPTAGGAPPTPPAPGDALEGGQAPLALGGARVVPLFEKAIAVFNSGVNIDMTRKGFLLDFFFESPTRIQALEVLTKTGVGHAVFDTPPLFQTVFWNPSAGFSWHSCSVYTLTATANFNGICNRRKPPTNGFDLLDPLQPSF